MKKKEFYEIIKNFKKGDKIKVHCRGMYGNYIVEGKLKKVDERGFVYLNKGFAHSYRKILVIRRIK